MKKIALTSAAWILAAVPNFASAQGDGGSQTRCELQYSTCKQTAKADYQFCKTASEKNCRPRLDKALKNCSVSRNNCQN